MKIDETKSRKFIREVIVGFKALDTELLAHKMVFEAFVRSQYSDADRALEFARTSPQVQKIVRQKYDLHLERLLKQADESLLVDTLLRWFGEWKPTGPVN